MSDGAELWDNAGLLAKVMHDAGDCDAECEYCLSEPCEDCGEPLYDCRCAGGET